MKQTSRYEDRLRTENEVAQEKYDHYVAKRKVSDKLKALEGLDESKAKTRLPTAQESFDFFTKVWDDGTTLKEAKPKAKAKKKAKKGRGSDADAEDVEETEDDAKLLTDELFEKFGGLEWNKVEPIKTQVVSRTDESLVHHSTSQVWFQN